MGPPTKKRKLNGSAVEEVVFDPAARFDYLTGFHKRKVQRTKAAQEAAIRRARQERIDDRKKLREERKADLERHVREVNALLPSRVAARNSDTEEQAEKDVDDEGEWDGISDETTQPVDHEAEYIDEDKYTTVTVEEVDISREGIAKLGANDEGKEQQSHKEEVPTNNTNNGKLKKPIKNKERDTRPKKKRQKFRYESPAERRMSRLKQRAKNSKQAQMRRNA